MALGDGVIDSAIQRKYHIAQQDSDVTARLKAAQTAEVHERTRLMPAQLELDRAKLAMQGKDMASQQDMRGAQTGLIGAQTTATNMQTGMAPGLIGSEIARNYGQAQAPGLQFDTGQARLGLETNAFNRQGMYGFADGTSMVMPGGAGAPPPQPGDSVPALLTPGEAVLTPEAANILGRPVIELLNALGQIQAPQMGGGMVDAKAAPKGKPESKSASKGEKKPVKAA